MPTKRNPLICVVLSLQLLQTACNGFGEQAGADRGPATKEGPAGIPNNTILHLGHSANLVKTNDRVLVFDYPFGSEAFKDILYPLDPNRLL